MSESRREEIRALLVDYLQDRLDPETRARVASSLRADPVLAEEFRFALRLQEDWVEAEQLDPQRLIALADGAPPTESERRHLEEHAPDRRHLDLLRQIGDLDATGVSSAPGSHGRSRPRPLFRRRPGAFAAGLLAVAAGLLLMIHPWRSGPELDLARLARVETLPVRMPRGAASDSSFEQERLRGLEAYRAQRWNEAIDALGSALGERPGTAEVALYLASAHMQRGEFEEAAALLRHADATLTSPEGNPRRIVSALHEEIVWQRAQCALLRRQKQEARTLLERVEDHGGRRAAEAHVLLQELRSA